MNKKDYEKYLDCDFYSVEEQNGEKVVHVNGYFCCPGDSCTDNPERIYRHVEVAWLVFPLEEFLTLDKSTLWDIASTHNQGINDLTEKEVQESMAHYFNGHPGTELPYAKLTLATPCGNYIAV